ncbi:MAG TPA: hypothetical protein VHC71_16685 [Hyphomicrobium sp.]|nr:hypothetical protein [Hyphomicrobium sp.]
MQILRARMTGLGERLDSLWSNQLREQLHLDRDTKECAYWHSGYHQALADLICLIEGPQPISGIADTSNPRLVAGRGAESFQPA